nr:immunoglobulin heavy chain junction region [Mus musculus]
CARTYYSGSTYDWFAYW